MVRVVLIAFIRTLYALRKYLSIANLNRIKQKTQDGAESLNWCKIVDAFQTSAIEAQDDYKLKNLVEQFNLSGSLLDV